MSIWTRLWIAGAGVADRIGDWLQRAGEQRDESAFAVSLIFLFAKMAKADGVVTPDEVVAFEQVFKIPEKEATHVRRLFNLARQDVAGFEYYAQRIASLYQDNPGVLEDVLDALFFIAQSDGVVHNNEVGFIERVAEIFGFSELEVRRLKASHLGLATEDPYLVLGVTPDISDDDLKIAYRRMMRENHPDALVGRGVPAEFVAVAEAKVAAVNAAYDQIRAERGF